METLKFHSTINAPKEKVWETLWNDDTYRQWTSVFSEGSYAESDWNEGSKILFLSPKGEGMFSVIDKKIPNEQMTFRHLGEIRNGVEEPKDWANALESYHLKENNGTTELTVALDATGEFAQYFNEIFPKALNAVKEIAEKN
jgi:uncharacterized protein YndB with AHSA1/START domain